jgi:hypothetical protein
MVLKCGDSSCSSNNTRTTVDSTGDVGLYSSIAIGGDGTPYISYYDQTNGTLKLVKCGNSACSSSNNIVTVDALDNVGMRSSIAIGTDGFPIIAYLNASTNSLQTAKCNDFFCSGKTISNISTDVDTTSGISIAIGTDGLPIIAYGHTYDYPKVRIVICGNSACSSGNTIRAPDYIARNPSITIGSDGLLIYSYFQEITGHLDSLKCGDPSCAYSSQTFSTIDVSENVGFNSTIAVGPDGLPVIAYYDMTNGDLKVAKCRDVACSSSNITTVDTGYGANVGAYPSVTIGTDGLPIISYYDDTNKTLKVAKCANPFCVNLWWRR